MRGKAKATTTSSARIAKGAAKLIGNARVSTADQDLAMQGQALTVVGVGVIFEEKASGTKREGRTELQKVLSVLGKDDALVVTRLDRLGRSLRDLANIAHEIEESGAPQGPRAERRYLDRGWSRILRHAGGLRRVRD